MSDHESEDPDGILPVSRAIQAAAIARIARSNGGRDFGILNSLHPQCGGVHETQATPNLDLCGLYWRQARHVGFLIGFEEALEIPWASSLREYRRYSPDMIRGPWIGPSVVKNLR